MRVPGLKTLRQARWTIRGRLLGGGVILGYHRVADDPGDPWGLCITPQHFDAQMATLRQEFEPVALARLDHLMVSPSVSRGSRIPVAVTFDDGYADVFTHALPILERHDVPATMFVVPEAVSGSFWWDRLRRILEAGGDLPAQLDVNAGGVRLQWTAAQGRPVLHRTLHRGLRSLRTNALEEALATMAAWAGSNADTSGAALALSDEQLGALGAHLLVEIGSHTMTHADLSSLLTDEVDHELRGSRLRLAERIGREVESFSYPHGGLGPEVRRSVARAGYRRACASTSGLVSPRTDRFLLPRLWPPPGPAPEFRRWIRSWTGR